jgi:glycosyltransferase involved in cell wall biosynthesis
MNILQVVPELNAGGVERTTIEIAEALRAKGHIAHVASQGGRMEDELRHTDGVLHKLPIGSKNPLLLRPNTKALITIIKQHKIDIVHARSRAPAWASKAAAQATGIPFLTTYHGIYNARSRLKRRYNAVMAKGDLVIANSHFTKSHIMQEHGIADEKIVVIPRGVDLDIFDPAKLSAPAVKDMRQSWGVKTKTPLILLPGRLTRWKGQGVAIEALSLLVKSGEDAHLVLLGDAQGRDDYVQELKSSADRFGIAHNITFAEHTRDMPTAYGAADIVIIPSTDPEAFGRVAIEAGAMLNPVIASDHGGTKETMIDGQSGFLAPPADPQALADALSKTVKLTAPQKAKNARLTRARITKHYSTQSLQSATLGVYQRLLEN